MSTLEIVINAVVTIICTSSIVTNVLFFREIRRQKKADAQQKEVETVGALANYWKDFAITQSDRHEEIRKEKKELWIQKETEKEKYLKIIADKDNQIIKLSLLQCKNIGCSTKEPPLTEICKEKNLEQK